MLHIRSRSPEDRPDVEALLLAAFGPDREQLTAYRVREDVPHIPELSLAAEWDGTLKGALDFWPVEIVSRDLRTPALLLGPLAVDPTLRGHGIGAGLMQRGLELAKGLGHRLVILVGDLPYYQKVGFQRQSPGQFRFPGPVDTLRVLYLELEPGSAEGVAGQVEKPGASANIGSGDRT